MIFHSYVSLPEGKCINFSFSCAPMRSWLHVHGWSCLFIQTNSRFPSKWLFILVWVSWDHNPQGKPTMKKHIKTRLKPQRPFKSIQKQMNFNKDPTRIPGPAQIKFILLPGIGTAGELGPQGASHQGLTKLHLRNRCQPHWLFEIHQVLSHSAMRALALAYFDLLAWGAHLRFQCTKSSDNALSMRRIMNLHVLNAQMLTLVCFSFRDPLLTVGWMVA